MGKEQGKKGLAHNSVYNIGHRYKQSVCKVSVIKAGDEKGGYKTNR